MVEGVGTRGRGKRPGARASRVLKVSGARSEGAAMGEGRACRYEPEVARALEERENRGGGVNVCARPRRKADRAAATAAAVSASSRIVIPRLPVLVIAPIA